MNGLSISSEGMDESSGSLHKPVTGADIQSGEMPATATPSNDMPPTHLGLGVLPSSAAGDTETKHSVEVPKESKIEPSRSMVLQTQIEVLDSLQTRMAKIHSLPAHLLIFHSQSPLISFGGLSGLGLGDEDGPSESDTINSILNPDAGTGAKTQAREMGGQARVAFRMLNDAREELVKGATQGALKAARDSEAQDKMDFSLHGRRTRKKRRVAAADSPAPFPTFHFEMTRVFPPSRPRDKKMEGLDDLVLFIREFNRSKSSPIGHGSRTKLGIWAPSRPKSGASRRVSDPLTVRVVIRDVTTVFVKLRHRNRDVATSELCVESVVSLGPREKVWKGPYAHSDFTAYQKLTQQIARMVEKEPNVTFCQLVDLLTSYEELFITHCSVCRRVLPLEGHVPPVARVWKDTMSNTEGERGHWEARHISCLYA